VSAARDLQAEQDHAEFAAWMEAQGYRLDATYMQGDMADAFAAGMQAERDLASGVNDPAYGTLRARITRLAETWEHHPELTEQGQVMRELGQVLRDELHHASDAAQEADGERVADHPDDCRCIGCQNARRDAEADEDGGNLDDAGTLDEDPEDDPWDNSGRPATQDIL
jgi:hypothetical protein